MTHNMTGQNKSSRLVGQGRDASVRSRIGKDERSLEMVLLVVVIVVVIQFLSNVVPLAKMAGFTPFLLQFLALYPSTCLVSGHPPPSNQSSLSPLPLASSRSSSVALTFSCHSLQGSEQPSKHYRHPSSAHIHTI